MPWRAILPCLLLNNNVEGDDDVFLNVKKEFANLPDDSSIRSVSLYGIVKAILS
jgi:hypothetical protein